MSNSNLGEPPVLINSTIPDDSFIAQALDRGKAMVVGGGIVGCQAVHDLSVAAERAGKTIIIWWIAHLWGDSIASAGSGGWHFPFLTDDPRIPRWANESFMNWQMLKTLGLTSYLNVTESVILTRHSNLILPAGYPPPATEVDPAKYGAEFYPYAHQVMSTVISSCAVLPQIHKGLAQRPGVRRITQQFQNLGEILDMATRESNAPVLLALGANASNLLGHDEVAGDLGMLLLAPTSAVPPEMRNVVLMDEDRNDELTYAIPHTGCGHTAFGGASGWQFTDEELRLEDGFRQSLAREIRDRLVTRLPQLHSTLKDEGQYRIWWGWRPSATDAIMRWLPQEVTGDIMVMELGGLGGSGYTATPGFVAEGLLLSASEGLVKRH